VTLNPLTFKNFKVKGDLNNEHATILNSATTQTGLHLKSGVLTT